MLDRKLIELNCGREQRLLCGQSARVRPYYRAFLNDLDPDLVHEMTGHQICYMIDENVVEAVLGAWFVAILGHRSGLCLIGLARDID